MVRTAGDAAGLTRWGRTGLILFALHFVLLFLPPIPPDVKGSLWSYLLGYVAVLVLLRELWISGPRVAERWRTLTDGRRWAFGLGLSLGLLALGIVLRAGATPLFIRFSREAGLWEPLSLLAYLGSGVLLLRMISGRAGAAVRHWRFVAGLYLLLGFEEIDYFGIFGGLIGRIDGVYVGSLHDLIMLAARGLLGPVATATIAAAAAAVLIGLWAAGYLQPRRLLGLVGSTDFLWVGIGLGLLLAGAAVEAELFGVRMAPPTLEESIELAGAIALAGYALQLSAQLQADAGDVSSAAI